MNTVKERKRLKIIFVTVILTLVVLACYSTSVCSAQAVNSQQTGSLMDPFSLNMIVLTATESDGSSSVVTRPTVRIAYRPVVRSYFRPPVVVR